jgi:uncharacterized membrane protein YphA (DoxX/SURF4 family)
MAGLWARLEAQDASRADEAIRALAASPRQAVALLRREVRPATPADPRRVARLIAGLDSEEFTSRESAARELEGLGELAEPALRKALAGRPTLEVRRRVERLLDRLVVPPSGDALRALRAVEVLEMVGTEEARRVLREAARGAPEARLTREAKASLGRLGGVAKKMRRARGKALDRGERGREDAGRMGSGVSRSTDLFHSRHEKACRLAPRVPTRCPRCRAGDNGCLGPGRDLPGQRGPIRGGLSLALGGPPMKADWQKDLTAGVLRLTLAVICVSHGYIKLTVTDNWAPYLHPTVAQLVPWGEVIGGLALGVGLLSRLAALGIGIIQVGAIAVVRWREDFIADLIPPGTQIGLTFRQAGFEYNIALLAMCIGVLVLGGGLYSLDHLLWARLRRSWKGAAVAPPAPGEPAAAAR